MKTLELNLMPGKPGLKGIAKRIKQLTVVAIALVFSYTTVIAQTGGRIMFNTPAELSKISNGLVTVKIKLDGADIKNYIPESVSINSNNHTESVSVKTMVLEGDYMLLTLDVSNTSLMAANNGGNTGENPQGTSKADIIGNLKEITIDNVSGVMSSEDNYNASIIAVNASVVGGMEAGSANGVRPNNIVGGGSNDNGGTSRDGGDDNNIITKDEVQGFVSAYPNPARDNMRLRSTNPKLLITEVTLINAIGAKLTTLRPDDDGHMVQIETGIYPAGVYFLQIKTNSGDAVKRIVIVN